MRATGRTTICMVMESIRGKMAGNTKDNISKIESMDLESILGQMADSMKANGRMDANMVKVCTGLMLHQNQDAVCGSKEKEINGSKMKKSMNYEPTYLKEHIEES